MKLHTVLVTSFLAATVSLSPTAFANQTHYNDATIKSEIQSKFSSDPTTSNLNVDVKVSKRTVWLNGQVNTDNEASKLIELADSVAGVKDVESDKLIVKESNQPLTDSAITAKVKGTFIREKLFGDKDVAATGINVTTTNGVVYLTGNVDTDAQAKNAVKLAQDIKGVKKVDSKLEVGSAS